MTKKYSPISLLAKADLIDNHWLPKVLAEMNDYQIKIAKIKGEFVWHVHNDSDETFLIVDGTVKILFRDGAVTLEKGDLYVVPKGVEHCPVAEQEATILLIEPKGLVNTGDGEPGPMTAANNQWL